MTFEREVSVVAARGLDGAFAAFDLCENEHERHILARTRVPAAVDPSDRARRRRSIARARSSRRSTMSACSPSNCSSRARPDGAEGLVVNELAPRVHNSGHWTIDGAQTSQFEQHVRAIAGWPLGAATRRGRIEMRNLIGEEAAEWRDILAEPDLRLHLYGKMEVRPGRKMGHVTRVLPEKSKGPGPNSGQ